MKKGNVIFNFVIVFLACVMIFSPRLTLARDPIKIGVLAGLTGAFAMLGTDQKNAIVLAAEHINNSGGIKGQKIELIIEDSGVANTEAIAGFHRIMREKPLACFIPLYGSQVLALMPFFEREGIPILTVSGTDKITEQGAKWLFRACAREKISKTAYTKFAVEVLEKKRIALEYVTTEYGFAGLEAVERTLASFNVKLVAVQSHKLTDKDFSAQLLSIKDSNPDVLLTQAHSIDGALLFKQQRQLGLNAIRIASGGEALPATMDLVSDEDVKGVYVEANVFPPKYHPAPEARKYAEEFEKKFKVEPTTYGLQYYDAMKLLGEVIKNSPAVDRENVRNGLQAIKYKGLASSIPYQFDKNGDGKWDMVIYKIGERKIPELMAIYQCEFGKDPANPANVKCLWNRVKDDPKGYFKFMQ